MEPGVIIRAKATGTMEAAPRACTARAAIRMAADVAVRPPMRRQRLRRGREQDPAAARQVRGRSAAGIADCSGPGFRRCDEPLDQVSRLRRAARGTLIPLAAYGQ
jgi:hypothetical protein